MPHQNLSKDKEGYQRWLDHIEEEIKEMLKEARKDEMLKEDEKYGDSRGDELLRGYKEERKAKRENQRYP